MKGEPEIVKGIDPRDQEYQAWQATGNTMTAQSGLAERERCGVHCSLRSLLEAVVLLLGMDPGTQSRAAIDAGESVCAVGVALEGRGQRHRVHVARQSDRVLALILDERPHAHASVDSL